MLGRVLGSGLASARRWKRRASRHAQSSSPQRENRSFRSWAPSWDFLRRQRQSTSSARSLCFGV